ncbi:hypothetical protein FACS1894161_4800 [Spirochaetia bacterium]|nr:hypothetical protein FACS1894161_4800 [Spirochaetia bacterium]
MEKTLFHIKEMDCPAEEQMVRMKLADFKVVKQLAFDLENRDLTVFHDGGFGYWRGCVYRSLTWFY